MFAGAAVTAGAASDEDALMTALVGADCLTVAPATALVFSEWSLLVAVEAPLPGVAETTGESDFELEATPRFC